MRAKGGKSFLIHRARFEVDLLPGTGGISFDEGLPVMLREGLLPVLERVLERFPWPSDVLFINSLVVDLGEMGAGEAEMLLPQRFEARLLEMLHREIHGMGVDVWSGCTPGEGAAVDEVFPKGDKSHVPLGQRTFQRALKALLIYGRGGRSRLKVMAGWSEFPWLVRQTFLFYAHDRRVPRHAARWLPRRHLKEIAALLSPGHGAFACGFVVKAAENRLLLKETAPVAGDADGFERQLWEFTLGYLLVEGRGRFEREQYVARLVATMASHENIDAAELFVAFQAIFARTNDAVGLEIQDILSGLAPKQERDKAEEKEPFVFALERVLQGKGTPTDFHMALTGIDKDPMGVQQVLLREGRKAGVRATLVKLFSHDQLGSLVATLGSEEAAMGRFIAKSIAHRSELQEHSPGVKSRESFSHQLWELSLAFLFVERRGRFNFKGYLHHLIQGMAARHNMSYVTLLGAFCRVYKAGSGKIEQENQVLLDELWMEEEQRGMTVTGMAPAAIQGPQPGEVEGKGRVTVSDRELVVRLWRHLAGGGTEKGASVEALAASLKKKNPVLFMRWLRDLQGRPGRIRIMVRVLGRPTLVWLLCEALKVLTVATPESIEALVLSCFSGPKGPVDADRVLHLLTGGGEMGDERRRPTEENRLSAVDGATLQLVAWMKLLEQGGGEGAAAMVARLKHGSGKEAAGLADQLLGHYRRSCGVDDKGRGVMHGGRELHRVVRALEKRGTLTQEASRCLVWDLQRALLEKPVDAKEALNGALRSWHAATRLAEIATEALCVRVLVLLAPSWRRTVLPLIDALNLGIASAGVASPLRTWRPLIWAWTFQLAASRYGMAMDPKVFLHTLLSWMARHGGATQVGALLAQVATNVRPETRGALLPVVEAMHGWLHVEGCPAAKPAGGEVPLGSPDPTEMAPACFEAETPKGVPERRSEDAATDLGREICRVENAGIVLLSPYLPPLFSRLGYLTHGRFNSPEDAERGVLMLHSLACKGGDIPEGSQALSRLLCGMVPESGIAVDQQAEASEVALAEEMLSAVVVHWSALKNTSTDGLREAFLMREGVLTSTGGAWNLEVMPKAWDVLLDHLPWGITPIKHPWMKRPLFVHWR